MRGVAFLAVGLATALATGCECDFFEPGLGDAGVGNRGIGENCAETVECRVGLVCRDGACNGSGEGLEGSVCTLTADCMDGLYCGPDRTCVPSGMGAEGDDCEGTADCMAGLVCVVSGFSNVCRASGTGDVGAACSTDVDCVAGLSCLQSAPGGGRSCQSPGVNGGDAGTRPPVLPLWDGETCVVDEGPPTAYFTVPTGDRDVDGDFYRLPFPNDIRRTPTGLDLSNHPSPGTVLDEDVLGRLINTAEQDLDGFATNPVVYFRFSQPYEWMDIDGDRLLLIDVTPSSPEYGRNLGRSWLTTAGPITRYICPNWLALRRGHGNPLRPSTTYAAVLLRGVRTGADEGHVPFEPSTDMTAMFASSRPSAAPLDGAWDAYQPLRDFIASPEADFTSADVLNAAVFTTQDPNGLLPALRDVVRAASPATVSDVTVCDGTNTSPCDDGADNVCGAPNDDYWEVHARIDLPRFMQGTPPFETEADGGDIQVDTMGVPQVAANDSVCMMMTIPKVTAAPAGGFPVVIYGHGTNGSFTSPRRNGVAPRLANDDGGSGPPNAITIGFDLPQHGTRRGASTREPSRLVFNFLNPRAARDVFLQGAADLFGLVYWAESYTLAAADSPTGFDVSFDPTRIAIYGHSQGANHAMLMLPYEPSVIAALISGGGGDLTESLLTKTSPINIARAVPLALLDVAGDGSLVAGDNHPALALIQMIYERSDGVNFGRGVYREPIGMTGRHVFMTYGMGDTFSTERTMNAYARSVGFEHIEPMLGDVGLGDPVPAPLSGNVTIEMLDYTVGLRQYAPDPGDDGHFVSTQTTQGFDDTTRFLLEALSGQIPPIGM